MMIPFSHENVTPPLATQRAANLMKSIGMNQPIHQIQAQSTQAAPQPPKWGTISALLLSHVTVPFPKIFW